MLIAPLCNLSKITLMSLYNRFNINKELLDEVFDELYTSYEATNCKFSRQDIEEMTIPSIKISLGISDGTRVIPNSEILEKFCQFAQLAGCTESDVFVLASLCTANAIGRSVRRMIDLERGDIPIDPNILQEFLKTLEGDWIDPFEKPPFSQWGYELEEYSQWDHDPDLDLLNSLSRRIVDMYVERDLQRNIETSRRNWMKKYAEKKKVPVAPLPICAFLDTEYFLWIGGVK